MISIMIYGITWLTLYVCMHEMLVIHEPLQIHYILSCQDHTSKTFYFSSLNTLLTTVYPTNDNRYSAEIKEFCQVIWYDKLSSLFHCPQQI